MTRVRHSQSIYLEVYADNYVLDYLIFNKEHSLLEVEVEDSLVYKFWE